MPQKYQDCSTVNQIIEKPSSDVTLKFKNKLKYDNCEIFYDYISFSKLKSFSRNSGSTSILNLDLWKNVEINFGQSQVKFQGINYSENIPESQYRVDIASSHNSTKELTSPTYLEMQHQVNMIKNKNLF